jgi:lipopolysaccharide transport system ATP-binding protein
MYMSKPVIQVENVSKRFIISHQRTERYTALRDVIAQSIKGALHKTRNVFTRDLREKNDLVEEFWALNNISFNVYPGDRIGIIGRNGAGKSTLLKVLSRITEPSEGRVTIRGRVASLLEVGTGFHPELTGRENIFLNGAILGMSRAEIRKKFDEIVAFAEVEQFLDTPVKRYSSGMYVRLAFAVAAHLEPEILIVDEVLAVGDAQFQKKCLGKMQDVSTNEGRTVLFVSHNMTAIQTLCNKGVLLKKGQVEYAGSIDAVIDHYMEKHVDFQTKVEYADPEGAPGNEYVKIKRAEIVPGFDDGTGITVETPFNIEFEFWNQQEYTLNLSLVLWNMKGECVFNVGSTVIKTGKGCYKGVCQVPANFLNDDKYFVQIYFIKDGSASAYDQADILSFEVFDKPRDGNWFGKWIGVVRPSFTFTLDKQ